MATPPDALRRSLNKAQATPAAPLKGDSTVRRPKTPGDGYGYDPINDSPTPRKKGEKLSFRSSTGLGTTSARVTPTKPPNVWSSTSKVANYGPHRAEEQPMGPPPTPRMNKDKFGPSAATKTVVPVADDSELSSDSDGMQASEKEAKKASGQTDTVTDSAEMSESSSDSFSDSDENTEGDTAKEGQEQVTTPIAKQRKKTDRSLQKAETYVSSPLAY